MPSITAVLSLFRPPQGVVDRVTRLLEQVDHVVAVDDSPAPATPGPVHEALRALGVEVVVLGENRGIAHALNVGVATARTADPAAWIMTLDQDSTLAPGFVSGSLAAFDAALAAGVPVGAVCPEKLGDVPTPDEGERDGFSLAYAPIQSGMVLPPSTLADCGPFREDYFIDEVDSEYTLRMRSHGLRVVRAPGVRLEHEMGEPRPMRFLGSQLTFQGKPAHVPYEAPFRVSTSPATCSRCRGSTAARSPTGWPGAGRRRRCTAPPGPCGGRTGSRSSSRRCAALATTCAERQAGSPLGWLVGSPSEPG